MVVSRWFNMSKICSGIDEDFLICQTGGGCYPLVNVDMTMENHGKSYFFMETSPQMGFVCLFVCSVLFYSVLFSVLFCFLLVYLFVKYMYILKYILCL